MLKPVGFWSYARQDDDHSDGQLSQLRAIVGKAINLQYGEELTLWQDIAAIPFGADWAATIERTIGQVTFFVPVVTPRYVKSANCLAEFKAFRDRMKALGRDDLIFPIYYVNVENLPASDTVFGDELAGLRRQQWIDFRSLVYEDPKSPKVRQWADRLAASVLNAMRREAPASQHEIEAARFVEEERRKREAAEETERRRAIDGEAARRAADAQAARRAEQQREEHERAEAEKRAAEESRRREEAESAPAAATTLDGEIRNGGPAIRGEARPEGPSERSQNLEFETKRTKILVKFILMTTIPSAFLIALIGGNWDGNGVAAFFALLIAYNLSVILISTFRRNSVIGIGKLYALMAVVFFSLGLASTPIVANDRAFSDGLGMIAMMSLFFFVLIATPVYFMYFLLNFLINRRRGKADLPAPKGA
ncbi:MAG: toll/interleukin-1 receptor domain-containing protein [Roseiarcus sp.]